MEKWATCLSALYLNFSKPILDLVLFSRKLSELVGWEGPAVTIGWYFLAGIIIRIISPSFGKYTAREQQLEGEYRAKHTDLLGHSEEIAFYNGSNWEKDQINSKFGELMTHIKEFVYKRFLMGIYDSMLVKYGAVMVGYGVLGLPVFGPNKEKYLKQIGTDPSRITKDYVRNSSLLINLAKAIGRIVVSYKEVQNLAGYTTLVYEMKEVLDDLDKGHYKRIKVRHQDEEHKGEEDSLGQRKLSSDKIEMMDNSLQNLGSYDLSENIQFDKVPILSPNGDTLVREMNFKI